jgi:uncharacterized protein YciI
MGPRVHYLLLYEFVSDYVERRAALRSQHLRLAWESQARGELILAGAYADPIDGAALVFRCNSRAVPEAFVASDPYVLAGLVTRWRIREWTTVVGEGASTPVRPDST